MILRHTTLTVNLPSIRKRGLDPRFSGGRTVGIWLHEPHRTEWAEGHIRNRDKLYGCGLSLTTIEWFSPS
jgi:hypothetical protein